MKIWVSPISEWSCTYNEQKRIAKKFSGRYFGGLHKTSQLYKVPPGFAFLSEETYEAFKQAMRQVEEPRP